MKFLYFVALVFFITCLVTLDRRYKLAFWHDASRTIKTVSIGVGVFVVWDWIGIALGIFHVGTSPYMLGMQILPNFPPEELVFLTLLCYTSLLLYRGMNK